MKRISELVGQTITLAVFFSGGHIKVTGEVELIPGDDHANCWVGETLCIAAHAELVEPDVETNYYRFHSRCFEKVRV